MGSTKIYPIRVKKETQNLSTIINKIPKVKVNLDIGVIRKC